MKDFTIRFDNCLLVIPHIASVKIDDIGRVVVTFSQGTTQEIGAGDQAPVLLTFLAEKVNEYWSAQTPHVEAESDESENSERAGPMNLELGNMQIKF